MGIIWFSSFADYWDQPKTRFLYNMVEPTKEEVSVPREVNLGEEGEQQQEGQENEEDFETNWDLEVSKFDDMGLKDTVLRGVYGYGFVDPSPI